MSNRNRLRLTPTKTLVTFDSNQSKIQKKPPFDRKVADWRLFCFPLYNDGIRGPFQCVRIETSDQVSLIFHNLYKRRHFFHKKPHDTDYNLNQFLEVPITANPAKLLLISFDALGSDALDRMCRLPNFSQFVQSGTLFRDVPGSFVSNTYPVHASIATGKPPREHGIISNNRILPSEAKPRWRYDSRELRAKTIWQAAADKKLRTAAVLWPVTAFSKDIAYNVPESAAGMGENQILLNLHAGSKWTQLKAFARHRHLMDGIRQPNLDRFSTQTMLDIIRENNPDLMLLHLTAYDSACHYYGLDSPQATDAMRELDNHLGKLLSAIHPNTTVVIFSDHSQLPVTRCFDPNTILDRLGFAKRSPDGTVRDARAFFLNADGNAILFHQDLTQEELDAVLHELDESDTVERQLTPGELETAGFIPERIRTLTEDTPKSYRVALGIAAKIGCYFSADPSHKATHGYPIDYPNYNVFFAVSKPDYPIVPQSILDVTTIVVDELGLKLD